VDSAQFDRAALATLLGASLLVGARAVGEAIDRARRRWSE